jgi:hypothetical protein
MCEMSVFIIRKLQGIDGIKECPVLDQVPQLIHRHQSRPFNYVLTDAQGRTHHDAQIPDIGAVRPASVQDYFGGTIRLDLDGAIVGTISDDRKTKVDNGDDSDVWGWPAVVITR